ncbi:hypothetical protein [Sphingomonas paucimobilis]|uniref:Uncharacterized protein n=1 Tax=Sphingomonas paucimobilis TaxID=13689 RepID=A0A7T3AAV3_SPHPI|nr:hypothetical protein [Sphingomonas paucimobilis]QPT08613.1 hypothetical protein I6G38_18150 [Sphingomonas paucimobilis]
MSRAPLKNRQTRWNDERYALNLLDEGATPDSVAAITGLPVAEIAAIAADYRGASVDPLADWRS